MHAQDAVAQERGRSQREVCAAVSIDRDRGCRKAEAGERRTCRSRRSRRSRRRSAASRRCDCSPTRGPRIRDRLQVATDLEALHRAPARCGGKHVPRCRSTGRSAASSTSCSRMRAARRARRDASPQPRSAASSSRSAGPPQKADALPRGRLPEFADAREVGRLLVLRNTAATQDRRPVMRRTSSPPPIRAARRTRSRASPARGAVARTRRSSGSTSRGTAARDSRWAAARDPGRVAGGCAIR